MKGTKRSALRVIVCVFAVGMMLAAATEAFAATTDISVYSRRLFTDTGINVRAGDSINIKASGFVHFGEAPIDHLTPVGIPLGRCQTLTASHKSKGPRPAPTLDCWSLIGRIGATGEPFGVGDQKTVRAATSGRLFLGVNDNLLGDNEGAWIANVTVAPASAGGTSAPAKSTTKTVMLMIGGLLIVAALIILAVFGRVRKSRSPKPAKKKADAKKAAVALRKPPPPEPIVAPEPAPVLAPGAAARPMISLPELEEGQSPSVTNSPAEGDFTDVNIFEVEFPDNTSLRVGYNYFPEGTIVRFRIAQRARPAANGSFVANGGGNKYHFVTVELGVELEPDPEGSDVSFSWDIGGVPFQYSVRRVPAG